MADQQHDMTAAGLVTWHSSEEDGGPDVGLSLGLGDGAMLWVGEGQDGPHQIVHYGKDARTVIGHCLDEDASRTLIDALQAALRPAASAPVAVPDGLHLAPWTPPEAAWNGLARDLIMWLDCYERPTPQSLLEHLTFTAREVPQWLRDEPEMQNLNHVISKGTRAVLIYRAMLEVAAAAPAPQPAQQEWRYDDMPTDRPIQRWHRVWNCPVAVYRNVTPEGKPKRIDLHDWIEQASGADWPDDAFAPGWADLPAPPSPAQDAAEGRA